jgi:gluconolactonase
MGPGGLFIFNSGGKLLGKIRTAVASSNVCFGDDEKTLFITNHQNVLRVRLRE